MRDSTHDSPELSEERSADRKKTRSIEPASAKAQRGRPRDPETDAQILKATLEELMIRGYNGTSLQKVADRAGVTKPTIYRRWPDKAALAVAAISELITHEEDISTAASRPDIRSALTREMIAAHEYLASGAIALIGALLTEKKRHPELIAAYRENVVNVRASRLRAILKSGVERGIIRPEANLEQAVVLLVGTALTSHITSDETRDWDWFAAATDVVLDGLRIH